MDKREKQTGSEVEHCVVCGKLTEYRKDTPIDKRERYVEGAGQLCHECYRKIFLNKD